MEERPCISCKNFFYSRGGSRVTLFLQGPFFSAEGDLGLHTSKNPGENTGNCMFSRKKIHDKAIFSTVQYWHPCWGAYIGGGGGG